MSCGVGRAVRAVTSVSAMHVGDMLRILRRHRIAAVPGEAGALGVVFSRRIEAGDLAVLDHLQPAADMDRGGRDHLAVLDQAEFGGAAADVDIEDALVLVARHARGAGAVGREHRLHVMAGGRGDEFAALLGQDLGDALRVLAPQRFAGENDDAGIDVVGRQVGRDIGIVDDVAELLVVDALFALVGRQRHRRLKQRLARDHVIAAGQILGEAAQMHAREDDLRAGGADIDADGGQGHIILPPQRIVLDRPVVVGFDIVVMIVVGVVVMRMHDVAAVEVVDKRVAGFLIFVVGHSYLFPLV